MGNDKNYKNIYDKYHKYLKQNIAIPDGQYFTYAKHRNYIHAYKYRLNDIPFPLGYVHNQRNALVDHPYHGHRIIRLAYILQWLVLQLVLFLYLSNSKFLKSSNKILLQNPFSLVLIYFFYNYYRIFYLMISYLKF